MDKKTYVAPTIKVVPFRMENGFFGSFDKKHEASDQYLMFETEDNRNEQYNFVDFWPY